MIYKSEEELTSQRGAGKGQADLKTLLTEVNIGELGVIEKPISKIAT